MKHVIPLVVLLAFALSACQSSTPDVEPLDVSGTWSDMASLQGCSTSGTPSVQTQRVVLDVAHEGSEATGTLRVANAYEGGVVGDPDGAGPFAGTVSSSGKLTGEATISPQSDPVSAFEGTDMEISFDLEADYDEGADAFDAVLVGPLVSGCTPPVQVVIEGTFTR